jgi:hypothetical protein
VFLPYTFSKHFWSGKYFVFLQCLPARLQNFYIIWVGLALGFVGLATYALVVRISSGTSFFSLGGAVVGILAGTGLAVEGLIGLQLDLNRCFADWWPKNRRRITGR